MSRNFWYIVLEGGISGPLSSDLNPSASKLSSLRFAVSIFLSAVGRPVELTVVSGSNG